MPGDTSPRTILTHSPKRPRTSTDSHGTLTSVSYVPRSDLREGPGVVPRDKDHRRVRHRTDLTILFQVARLDFTLTGREQSFVHSAFSLPRSNARWGEWENWMPLNFTRTGMRLQVSCDCPLSPRDRFSNWTILPRGERARVRGNFTFVLQLRLTINRSAPSSGLQPSFPPDLGGEGTCERLPLMASILNAHGINAAAALRNATILSPVTVGTVDARLQCLLRRRDEGD